MKSGKARSWGVSNWGVRELEQLYQATGIRPMVNQIGAWAANRHLDCCTVTPHVSADRGIAAVTPGSSLRGFAATHVPFPP